MNNKMRISYASVENIELTLNDFLSMLYGVKDEYELMFLNELPATMERDTGLIIDNLEKGSWIVDLIAVSQPLFTEACQLVQFYDYFNALLYKLKGNNIDNLNVKNCQNVMAISNPIINNYGKLDIQIIGNSSDNKSMEINKDDAKIIHTNALNHKKELEKKLKGEEYKNVSFLWSSADFEKANRHDSGIIEEIDSSAKKVKFSAENLKQQMMIVQNKDPWYKLMHLVDVNTIVKDNKICGYEITKVYSND